jgi:hypothetical protein
MIKRPKVMMFLEPEEIKNELKSLQIQWDKIKETREDKKSIESQFKEVEKYLKKSEMPGLEVAFGFYASSSLFLLKNNIQSDTFNYDRVISSASPSEKISVFMTHKDKFTDEEYWMNLAEAYIMQNYKKIPYKVYRELFSAKKANREKLMSEKELKLLKRLPNEIKIYRGGSKTEEKTKRYGISWTLDKKVAEDFAKVKAIRDKKEMVVFEKNISKKEVVAFFISRKEKEIIYLSS